MRKGAFIWIVITLITMLSAISSGGGIASQSPESILKGAYKAEDTLQVHGIKETIATLPKGTVKVRVELWQSNGKRLQIYLAGPLVGDKVLEMKGDVYYISPKLRRVTVTHPPIVPNSAIDLMLRNYRVERAGEDLIAERRCVILWIKPVHRGNPSRKVWIDSETLFPLRKESYNSNGELESVSMFTEIEYAPDIPEGLFKLPEGWMTVERPGFKPIDLDRDLSSELGFKPILLKNLPEGYVLSGAFINAAAPGPLLQVKYTDGMNQISLFERIKVRGRGMGMGWMRGRGRRMMGRKMMWGRKACMMFEDIGVQAGRAVMVPHPRLLITIVGDVSEEIMRHIVEENFR